MYPSIEALLVREGQTLKEAMITIDSNAQGICFAVNETGKLVGILTDGDIRRALIEGATVSTLVKDVMKKNYLSLPVNTPIETVQSKLSSEIHCIPLVDEAHHPVDYASFTRLHRIPIMEPLLNGNELNYVTDCIKTGWISSQGAYVRRFEKEFAEYCGAPYALAVSNGTVALHLALAALDIKEGDEVIVPDLTFAASINAIVYTGATPVIADVSLETWTIDIDSVRACITPRTKAIMPVHLYGHPCHMDELMAIAKEHNLYIVEDCAEALGSLYKGKHVGVFGETATFSFFGNKTITTGEGGMVLFKNKEQYEKAAVLRDHGMSKQKRYWHDFVGFNYRMTNLQGAIGVAQMERLTEFVEAKRKLASRYTGYFSSHPGIITPPEASWARSGYWLYTMLINSKEGISRDEFMEKMLKNGVETRPVFYPLHEMPPYIQYARGSYPNTEYISQNGVSLPSSVHISDQEMENIAQAIHTIFSARHINTI